LDSQDSPWSELGESHHLPPYSILYASPQGPHPNDILSRDSQMGVSKFPSGSSEIPKHGTHATLGAHNFVCRPPIEMSSEAKL